MEFTVYDTATGKVKRWGIGTPDPKASEGEAYIEGEYPAHTYRIVNGVPTVEPPSVPIERLRLEARNYVVAQLDSLANTVSGIVPESERSSWDAKEAAVTAIANGTATQRQQKLIEIEAAIVGETVATTVSKIQNNIAMFYIAGPTISGIRRKAFRDIELSTTEDQLEIVKSKVTYIFSAVMLDPITFNNDPVAFLQNLE